MQTTVHRFLTLVCFVAALSLFNGCSWLSELSDNVIFWEEADPVVTPATSVPGVEANSMAKPTVATTPTSTVRASIRLKWLVPGEAVETYHLSYGEDPTNLNQHISLPVNALKKVDDQKHGPVFVYDLQGVSSSSDIYVSLRAENKSGLSEAMAPVHIPAEENR